MTKMGGVPGSSKVTKMGGASSVHNPAFLTPEIKKVGMEYRKCRIDLLSRFSLKIVDF